MRKLFNWYKRNFYLIITFLILLCIIAMTIRTDIYIRDLTNDLERTNNHLKTSLELQSSHAAITNDLRSSVSAIENKLAESYKGIELELPSDADLSRKTYMDYRHITDKTTTQWKLQQGATTNEDGIRVYGNVLMGAFGQSYADIGDYILVELDTGKSFLVINADQKALEHTDPTNRYSLDNKDVIEFIVDENKLDSDVKYHGDISPAGYEGSIIKLTKVEV